MVNEQWRAVPGHPGYEVSDQGRVRSLDRVVLKRHPTGKMVPYSLRGKPLRPGTVKSGHQIVVLGRGNNALVHALVLAAFVGPCPAGYECCHWDDNPSNNHLSNLRWGTRADNLADFKRNRGHYQQWPETRVSVR